MKKTALIFAVMFAVLCICLPAYAVVPTDDGYTTIVDWSSATEADLNGGNLVDAFTDLSYFGVDNKGTQSLENGNFVLTVGEPVVGPNCYQFSVHGESGNGELWSKSSALRFYVENNTDSDVLSLTLYLWISGDSAGYERPFTCGSETYMYDENGKFFEPDFRLDSSYAYRYIYIPQGFKGWVVIPSSIAADCYDDVYFGWLPSYWSIGDGIDLSIADFANVTALGFDIRADEAYEGTLVIGNLELLGDEFDKPDPADVLDSGKSEDPTEEPAGDTTEEPTNTNDTEPSETEPAPNESDDPNQPGNENTGIIIGIAAGVAIIAAVVIIVIVNKKKKKNA